MGRRCQITVCTHWKVTHKDACYSAQVPSPYSESSHSVVHKSELKLQTDSGQVAPRFKHRAVWPANQPFEEPKLFCLTRGPRKLPADRSLSRAACVVDCPPRPPTSAWFASHRQVETHSTIAGDCLCQTALRFRAGFPALSTWTNHFNLKAASPNRLDLWPDL
jgi:hypothetical protein